jgi:hypothetical protein
LAVFGFLFLNARVEQNDIVSLIGMLLAFGLLVKVEDNFVLGLFAGLIYAGIIVDLDCTSNEFLGINGIIWMSLAELVRAFAALINTAIASAGFATAPGASNNTLNAGRGLAGNLQAFGVAVIAKVHRNVFFTFSRGVYKTDAVISADISIVDNTFSLCSLVAIELGGGGKNMSFLGTLASFISLRHLVQSNGIAGTGRGIVSSSLLTQVEQNSVQCPAVAVELDAAFCSARNNTLIGLSRNDVSADSGLLILHGGATNAVVAGNQLLNAPSHSILIQDSIFDLVIEDNRIRGAGRFGIGTLTDSTLVQRVSISRNHVENCSGDLPVGSKRISGAVVLGECRQVRFIDNVVNNNSPSPPAAGQPVQWFAVSFEDVDEIEVSGNRIVENFVTPGPVGFFGAISIQRLQQAVRIQDNLVRGNGGIGLALGDLVGANVLQRALVQNNHFEEGPNPLFFFVAAIGIDSMLFQGNQCVGTRAGDSVLPPIFLLGARANVTGNMVDFSVTNVLAVGGIELLVSSNSVRSGRTALRVNAFGGPAIVTSNLTSGILTSPGVLRANNVPAP